MKSLVGSILTIDYPVECPSADEMFKATRILNNQATAIYQILYVNGFVKPGNNGEFRVSRISDGSSCGMVNSQLFISHKDEQHKHYAFYIKTSKDALEKVRLVSKAIEEKLTKPHVLACCPLAARRPCVCLASFTCLLHGKIQCHGSHD